MASQSKRISGDLISALITDRLEQVLPREETAQYETRIRIFRIVAIANMALGLNYFWFRYARSLNMEALWFAIPLLLAETYSFLDTALFIFMMWHPKIRQTSPAPEGKTVDIFITTYSEPIELVRQTTEAALRIEYPHQTFVLDDGSREELQAICEDLGCGYITRGAEWQNRPRHAKAGNVNNALMQTSGEFILILDADQIPSPEILDRVLGYFDNPNLAFVQTPQYFYNVPDDDPFGSQAPLFYGPIQQGKDGWNAAFFCGSNAVLRRDALFQLGLVTYVEDTVRMFKQEFSRLPFEIRSTPAYKINRQAAKHIASAASRAVWDLRENKALALVLADFQAAITQTQRMVMERDLGDIHSTLSALAETKPDLPNLQDVIKQGMLTFTDELAALAPTPESLGLSENISNLLQMEMGEALDISPLATFSITEDMATAMRLHSLGWESVFHSEVLAKGLAPEDLASALGQRLRWAAGTIQVMIADNPLLKKGLSWPQRLQYFTTMYSYFSGFVSLIYLVSPVIYLFTGIAPVNSYAGEFLWRIVPYLIFNKLMFILVAWGIKVTRGEQYSLALFPLWIQAVITVFGGDKLTFNVTPKERQTGVFLNLVLPQLSLSILLALGMLYGLFGLLVGWRNDLIGVLVNIFWASNSILLLSVILRAAVYRPPSEE